MQAARLPLQWVRRRAAPSGHRSAMSLPRGGAEREREGSTARSIQRMKMRRVGRCRATAAQQPATNTRRMRPPEWKNSNRRISRCHVPNLWFSQKRQRAGFCSTAPARVARFVSLAWNGTGTRFAPCLFPMSALRTHNDSKPRSMSRSQSRRQCSACSSSHCVQSSNDGQFSNLFLRIEHRRDCPGSDAFRRHNIGNVGCRLCGKRRLLDPRCH